jgi:hypothetical protein
MIERSLPTSPPDAHTDPTSLSQAILRTLLYADIFSFPLTAAEIHHFLIGLPASSAQVAAALADSRWLNTRLDCGEGYYALRGRGVIIASRQARDAASRDLWPDAVRYGRVFAHLPFVRMVALTGSLAVRNPRDGRDDIDYLIVTEPGRVWLARAMAVLVVRLAKLRGVWLCPNYILARTALAQEQTDLYIAHELAQMIPLAGRETYLTMRGLNRWVEAMLPNAAAPFYAEPDAQPKGVGRLVQRIGELLLGWPLGDWLEGWERRRKQRKFRPEITTQNRAAQLDEQRVKGHFNDHGNLVMARYHERLQQYDLLENDETFKVSFAAKAESR